MSSVDAKRLYQLLPAIYRLRDADQGYPLRALIEVLEGQGQVVEADIARLYENWFIETCDEWVVPYIGDLLGVRGLLPSERAGWSQRALVANTLQYRQRKGTVPLLEQLVHDVAGWAARAVEFYNEVSVTQFLDHLRPGLGSTANLRELKDSTLIGSAFDPMAYTPDVRLMSGTRQAPQQEGEQPAGRSGRRLAGVGQGRPNLPNIGLYIWRLKPYRIELATAYSHGDGQRFSFNPLGIDIPLFNMPDLARDFSKVAREHELPVALRTEALAEELEALRRAVREDREPEMHFFGERPAFEIYLPGSDCPVDFKDVLVCDLGDWGGTLYGYADERHWGIGCELLLGVDTAFEYSVVVDPKRGRIFLPGKSDEVHAGDVRISYSYAFRDNISGGPYDRRSPLGGKVDTIAHPEVFGTLILIPSGKPGPETDSLPNMPGILQFSSISSADKYPLKTALNVWSATYSRPPAVIQIASNATYCMPANPSTGPSAGRFVQDIDLKASQLVIQAANERRPVLVGDLNIKGNAATAELTLSGLLIAGQIRISGKLGRLTIVDCTLMPGFALKSKGIHYAPLNAPLTPSIVFDEDPGASFQVMIERSVAGPVFLPCTISSLTILDSIIDAPILGGGQLPAIAGDDTGKQSGPATRLERVTVFGKVHVREMPLAENVLFTSLVTSVRPDIGVLHNCYIPKSSDKFRCEENCLSGLDALQPAFTTRIYGRPGYAQLSLACPAEIRTGGTDGAEIGVFHRLHQPQREAALLAQLEEYLRFGLEAGLIYEN